MTATPSTMSDIAFEFVVSNKIQMGAAVPSPINAPPIISDISWALMMYLLYAVNNASANRTGTKTQCISIANHEAINVMVNAI